MPEFLPGEEKTAVVPMTNPTVKAFDYSTELYMGTNLVLMAKEDFHLEAKESKDIELPVIMPSTPGTYPVYIAVLSDGQFIEPLYQFEDVVIGPFDPWSYDFNGNGIIETSELLAAANDYYAGVITKAQLDQVTALWELIPPFDPWSYDFNGDGLIKTSEYFVAVNDYYAGIITYGQVEQVRILWKLTPPPWSYDINGNEKIDTLEMLSANDDYYAGIITKEQFDQVYALWELG